MHTFSRCSTTMRVALLLILVAIGLTSGHAQAPPADAPAPAPDTLIFTNGDQLSGKLLRATGDTISFHSDMAGDLDIPAAKIKELRSSGSFAVLKKDQNVVGALVRPTTVHIEDGKLVSSSGAVDTIPVSNIGYIIDEPTFRRETNPHPSFLYGWNGSIAAGATLVRSTQKDTTLTAAINLVRTIPTVHLPAAAQSHHRRCLRDLRHLALARCYPADQPANPGIQREDKHLPRRRGAG